MQKKYNAVIADTSCFILLEKINELNLLRRIFGRVETTPLIKEEFGKPLPEWVTINSSTNQRYEQIIKIEVDQGEASESIRPILKKVQKTNFRFSENIFKEILSEAGE